MFLIEEVQKLDRSSRWNYAFQVLNLETREVVEDFTLNAARLPEHRNLNRYRDVLPYDHSRVKLQGGDTNYINGNVVEVEEIGRKYILTQGPLPDTCNHFWQMVWEQNTATVVMLNKVIEKNAVKCHPYWPMGEDEVHEYGDYRVRNHSERAEAAYVVRDLILHHIPTDETKNIKQFHYMLWPDFGVPSKPETFLHFLHDVRDSGAYDEDRGPPVIHCSAGIGRSGTFCLVDSVLLKAELDGKPDNIDVKEMLLHLRKYRVGLVQTPEQFRFSYLAIIQGIANIYPDAFKLAATKNEETNKRKVSNEESNEEPPPVPPRKRAPPEKPPRRMENTETTAAEESLKQKKMVKKLRDGIVDESSDEEESDEEVLDLSASEDEDDLLELYESEDERTADSREGDSSPPSPPEYSYPEKPLPPLPSKDSGKILESVDKSDSQYGENIKIVYESDVNLRFSEKTAKDSTIQGGFVERNYEQSVFNSSEDERIQNKNIPNKREITLESYTIDASQKGSASNYTNNDVSATASSSVAANYSGKKESETENQENGNGGEDDQGRKEKELRQRKRRDEKNKQTAEMIQNIKTKMQEKEIAAARRVFFKKSLIAVCISGALLLGYYWLFR